MPRRSSSISPRSASSESTTSTSGEFARSSTRFRRAHGPKRRSTTSVRHLILMNEDEGATQAFAELYRRFPKGPRAERAAWKAGWWAYKTGSFAETIRLFESVAVAFPRSDYRPSYLYWAARAHEQLEAPGAAIARYRVVIADYQNSYYGRLAETRLEPLREGLARIAADGFAGPGWAAAGAPRQRRSHPAAALARPARRGVERAAVRGARVGPVPGGSGDDRLGVLAPGRLAPGDHSHASRVPAPHDSLRRLAAAGRAAPRDLSRWSTGATSAATPPHATSIRT